MDIIKFSVTDIVDLSITIVLLVLIVVVSFLFKFSKYAISSLIGLGIIIIVTYILNLRSAYFISCGVELTFIFVYSIFYLGNIKSFFKNLNTKNVENSVIKKSKPDKIIDKDTMYKEIYETCKFCSTNKIGALITFEKHDDLFPLTKNGTKVNAPITHELLTTIFYPGTRLHDGAVIIKNGLIYAASVYYTPTTKALTGKFGSRHRAALGISEISDSVTIVVSEETGRISIAESGELESVSIENLVRELSDRLED